MGKIILFFYVLFVSITGTTSSADEGQHKENRLDTPELLRAFIKNKELKLHDGNGLLDNYNEHLCIMLGTLMHRFLGTIADKKPSPHEEKIDRFLFAAWASWYDIIFEAGHNAASNAVATFARNKGQFISAESPALHAWGAAHWAALVSGTWKTDWWEVLGKSANPIGILADEVLKRSVIKTLKEKIPKPDFSDPETQNEVSKLAALAVLSWLYDNGGENVFYTRFGAVFSALDEYEHCFEMNDALCRDKINSLQDNLFIQVSLRFLNIIAGEASTTQPKPECLRTTPQPCMPCVIM